MTNRQKNTATGVKQSNWFVVAVTLAVIVTLVAIAAMLVFTSTGEAAPEQTLEPRATPQNASIEPETGAISVGSGPNTLDTFIDFMCPVCNNFEQVYGDTIQDQVNAGTLTLKIHPISILDRLSQGTEFSSRAAGAMYCVAHTEPDKAVAFMQAMYANQPAEGTAGLTDGQIVQVADGAGVTDTGTVAACITDGTFKQYAQVITQKTPVQPNQPGISTPTLVLNGETLVNRTLTGDPQVDIVNKLTKQ